MKTLGLVGGMSWESTAVYYRLLNEQTRERLGGLHSAELLMWSFDFAAIEGLQAAGDWDGATARMTEAARRLEGGGARALVICSNTMHRMAEAVEQAVAIPLIHIADATAGAIGRSGCRLPLLLATRFTMEQDFYRGRLRERWGIETVLPEESGRETVHRIIYEELCVGRIREESRQAYHDVIARAQKEKGADGVILGCTEIGLLLREGDLGLPSFETTGIHCAAALDFALS